MLPGFVGGGPPQGVTGAGDFPQPANAKLKVMQARTSRMSV
jgi:hypothetical protein